MYAPRFAPWPGFGRGSRPVPAFGGPSCPGHFKASLTPCMPRTSCLWPGFGRGSRPIPAYVGPLCPRHFKASLTPCMPRASRLWPGFGRGSRPVPACGGPLCSGHCEASLPPCPPREFGELVPLPLGSGVRVTALVPRASSLLRVTAPVPPSFLCLWVRALCVSRPGTFGPQCSGVWRGIVLPLPLAISSRVLCLFALLRLLLGELWTFFKDSLPPLRIYGCNFYIPFGPRRVSLNRHSSYPKESGPEART